MELFRNLHELFRLVFPLVDANGDTVAGVTTSTATFNLHYYNTSGAWSTHAPDTVSEIESGMYLVTYSTPPADVDAKYPAYFRAVDNGAGIVEQRILISSTIQANNMRLRSYENGVSALYAHVVTDNNANGVDIGGDGNNGYSGIKSAGDKALELAGINTGLSAVAVAGGSVGIVASGGGKDLDAAEIDAIGVSTSDTNAKISVPDDYKADVSLLALESTAQDIKAIVEALGSDNEIVRAAIYGRISVEEAGGDQLLTYYADDNITPLWTFRAFGDGSGRVRE